MTGSPEHEEAEKDTTTKASSPGATMPLPTVLLDRKIESLISEWNKNADMLFTIHPVDGTFLLWHVNYLDEYNPGIFRQVQVLIFAVLYFSKGLWFSLVFFSLYITVYT